MHTGPKERPVSPVKMISLVGRNRAVYGARTVLKGWRGGGGDGPVSVGHGRGSVKGTLG